MNENEFCPPQLEERKLSFLTAIGTTDSLEGLISHCRHLSGDRADYGGGEGQPLFEDHGVSVLHYSMNW